MTRSSGFALVLILLVAPSALRAADKRTYRCYTLGGTPPKVDGQLDDAAWKSLPVSSSFRNLTGGDYAEKQTYIKLGWDKDNLYIGVRCDEPEMKLVSARMGDGDALWTEDSIEIFLQPEPSAGYFQFGINSVGAKVGAERASGLMNFEAKGLHGPDFYTIEIKLPFALLGKTPRPGEAWSGNIDRNVWSGAKVYSCWAPLQGSFHDTANFGEFVFDGQQATPELAAAAEQSDPSDKAYRDDLIARINEVVKKCQEYEPELAGGLALPAYRAEAQEMQKRVGEFKTLQSSIPTASLKELAAGARSYADFFKRLFDFKYRVLLTKLIEEPDAGQKK